jgi:hypothetical protein
VTGTGVIGRHHGMPRYMVLLGITWQLREVGALPLLDAAPRGRGNL